MRGGPFRPLVVPQSEGNWHGDESALLSRLIEALHQEKLDPKHVTLLKRYVRQMEISRGVRPVPTGEEDQKERETEASRP
jgi:hypothetical protein